MNKKNIIVVVLLSMILCFASSTYCFATEKPGKVSYGSIKASSISYYSMTLKWDKATNAKKYKVAYRYSEKRTWTYTTTTNTSVTLNNLLPNTKYTVKIKSINGTSSSDWTNGKTFTTKETPYTKRFSPQSKTNSHVIGVIEGGWISVKTNTHITEHYKYDNGYKKFGYRCYGVSFSSINSQELLDRLDCGIQEGVVHYKEKSDGGYTSVKCNSYSCIHDHLYSGDTFSHSEVDSTTLVSHKKESSGYITIVYCINGSIVTPKSVKVKFAGITK